MTRETMMASASELRFADGAEGVFEGYAALFNDLNSFNEIIKPGAFKKTIRESRGIGGPAMFLSHDPTEPIGVWESLEEDTKGLKVRGKLADTSRGRDVLTLLKAKALTGLSIGFRARQTERTSNGGRLLVDVEVVEISLVSLPAARRARVSKVRMNSETGIEQFIREATAAAQSIRGQHANS